MDTRGTALIPRTAVTGVLTVGTGIVLALFVGVFALGRVVEIDHVKDYVDVGAESILPTWWSTLLLALVGLLALAARRGENDPATRRAWALVAFVGALLSLDEATQLHERLRYVSFATGLDVPTYAWVVPGAVVALAGMIVLILVGRRLPRQVGRELLVAALVFVTGALGMEALGGFVSQDGHDLRFSLVLLVEEGLEMTGSLLAVLALVRYLEPRLRLEAEPELVRHVS